MNFDYPSGIKSIYDYIDIENLPDEGGELEDRSGWKESDLFFKGDYAFEDEGAAKAALFPIWLHRAKTPGAMTTRLSLLACAMAYSDTGGYLSYSRHKARYSGMKRYFGLGYTYRNMMEETVKLSSKGLLEHIIEHPMSHRSENPKQSRFKATQKCVDTLGHLKLRRLPPEYLLLRAMFEFDRMNNKETMVFWKEPGKTYTSRLIGYHDDDTTKGMRDRLNTINGFLSGIKMEWPGMMNRELGPYHRFDESGVLVTPLFVTRSFCRNSFGLYGRFHGFWQNHKFWSRQLIKLDGEETCEPDYSQIHVNLSYLEKGLIPPTNGYSVEGYDRDTIKATFPILLNSCNIHAAAGALASELEASEPEAFKIIAKVKEVHSPIADRLHSDYGVELMFIDSQICEKVMLQLVKEKIPFLPIHDGYRIPKSKNDRVTQIMKDAFASFYPGFESHVKTKVL